mmetsp:Transcript_46827/g.117323  ORF Transcript_46827/g.117323 Transcript_46827/m.117323 type:complete len:167 (+) Transcript_46827:111-611(+)
MATLFHGLNSFITDMKKTVMPIAIWASLFPFPQFLVGGYLTSTRGIGSPAAWMFAARAVSFVVAGQISLRRPLSKFIGPIMHIPFLVTVPLCVQWLRSDAAGADANMQRFIAYTTAITSVSLVLDSITAIKYFTLRRRPDDQTCTRCRGTRSRGPTCKEISSFAEG